MSNVEERIGTVSVIVPDKIYYCFICGAEFEKGDEVRINDDGKSCCIFQHENISKNKLIELILKP